MTHDNRSHLDRRTVLKSSGIALAGLGGLTSTVAARGNGDGGKRVSLIDGPAEFQLFWSGADGKPKKADDPFHFGYPVHPTDIPFDGMGDNGAFLGGEDPVGGLFDASEIEMTPKGQTLHHTLQFFQGHLMERNRGKPYTLTNEGLEPLSGVEWLQAAYRFVARGQNINFDAVSAKELGTALTGLPISTKGDPSPLFILADSSWRAVGSEVVFVAPDQNGEPSRSAPFSATRIDFYRRASDNSDHRGPPQFELSLVYIIYPDFDPDDEDKDKTGELIFQPMPKPVHDVGLSLIESGPRNLGGQ